MHTTLLYLYASVIGALISIMVVLNTRLGELSSMAVSFLINHAIGIVVITGLLAFQKVTKKTDKKRAFAPWYYWFGGVFGFIILNANYITITHIGASLSMATAVFGQSLASVLFDITGFMGMPMYKIERKKVITLSLSLFGIIMMALSGGSFTIPYVLIGIATGLITMTQMVYNARFASRKGVLFSARNNVITGFILALIVYGICIPQQTFSSFSLLSTIEIPIIVGGGLIAVFVVCGLNYVISKIPTLYVALLLSSSQIICSIVIDRILYNLWSPFLFAGALIMLLAMAGNVYIDRQKSSC